MSEYAFDYEYEPFRAGMSTRYTVCRVYDKAAFQEWRRKQNEAQDIIKASPNFKDAKEAEAFSKLIRIRKPKPIMKGIATWSAKYHIPFNRLEGARYAKEAALKLLSQPKIEVIGKQKPQESEVQRRLRLVKETYRQERHARWVANGSKMSSRTKTATK